MWRRACLGLVSSAVEAATTSSSRTQQLCQGSLQSVASCLLEAGQQPYSTWKVHRREYPLPPEVSEVVKSKAAGQVPIPEPQLVLAAKPLLDSSHRVGCLAIKAGMTHDWDEWGVRIPLTVLWIDDCQVRTAQSDWVVWGCGVGLT